MRAAGGVSVLLAGALVTAMSGCGDDQVGHAAAGPSASPAAARVLATVAGVRVTWLPAPYSAVGGPDSNVIDGGVATTQDFISRGGSPRLGLNVSRGVARTVARELANGGDGAIQTAVHVHAIAAQLTLFKDATGTEGRPAGDWYFLTWTEAGADLTVSGMSGASRADVERFAAGLVVDPAGAGFASPAAEQEIRAAFADAFTGRSTPDPATALGAVENGEQLRFAYDRLVATLPETARSARVTVQRVTFSAADRAQVQFSVSAQIQGRGSSVGIGGSGAVRVNGGVESGARGLLPRAEAGRRRLPLTAARGNRPSPSAHE